MRSYVKFKACDVIGAGTYKRYVNACKDKGDKWALEVTHAVQQVTHAVRSIQALVNDLRNSSHAGLHTMCQTVIENNTPPIDQTTVNAECLVSGKPKCQCIVLKCKGRGAPCVMVQSRFGHFVLMLWTVYKMDLVIKTVTRDFIDAVDKDSATSMLHLCQKFSEVYCFIRLLRVCQHHTTPPHYTDACDWAGRTDGDQAGHCLRARAGTRTHVTAKCPTLVTTYAVKRTF
eukprot:2414169-Rhodomonas_salina.3